jgi:hypothetical protein
MCDMKQVLYRGPTNIRDHPKNSYSSRRGGAQDLCTPVTFIEYVYEYEIWYVDKLFMCITYCMSSQQLQNISTG